MERHQTFTNFEVFIKGEFPKRLIEMFVDLNFKDFCFEFGTVKFAGTTEQLEELIEVCSLHQAQNLSTFTIIGFQDKTETLVEIYGRKDMNGNVIESLVFELHNPKNRFKINFEEGLFLLKQEDRTRFQSRFPDPFRAFVKINDFKSIINI